MLRWSSGNCRLGSVEESFHVRDRLERTTIESGEGRISDLQSTVEAVEQTFTGAVVNASEGRQPDGTDQQIVQSWSTFWRTGDFGGVACLRINSRITRRRALQRPT